MKDNLWNKELGQRLNLALIERKISRKRVSEELLLHSGNISDVISGKRGLSKLQIKCFKQFLGIDLSNLPHFEPEQKPLEASE